jgi:hypothetical protein
MRKIQFIALTLIAFIFAPQAALAADIPLLTWERGRQQQVIIAELDKDRQWVTKLVGNDQPDLEFVDSGRDANGYVAHTVDIPNGWPTGAYEVVTFKNGTDRQVIAGVLLVEAATRTAASDLFDLTAILAIFIFLTALTSTIRAQKYRFIPFKSAQVLPRITDPIMDGDENFWDRLENAPYRLRVNWLNSFKPSLLRFILIREGELAHHINKKFYGVAPFLGLIAGAVASIDVNKSGGVAASSTILFLVFAFIGIFDAFSGLAAALGFWAIQIGTGNVSSLRDILIALSIAITWVGPSIFFSILRESIGRDFPDQTKARKDSYNLIGIVASSLVGGVVFFFGQSLLQSIIYIERPLLEVTIQHALIVAGALLIRGITENRLIHARDSQDLRDESFTMARVVSPLTSLLVFLAALIFLYSWTQVLSTSLIVSVIFSVPYFFSFIRFNANKKIRVEKIRRNIVAEALVLMALTFIFFREISTTPYELGKRVEILLMLAGIAPAIHGILSALYCSNEEEFSFERKTEIIEP